MPANPFFGLGHFPPNYGALLGGPPAAITPVSAEFNRERYYGALWSRLMGLKLGGLVKTASRKVANMEELQPGQLPALYMDVAKQSMKQDYNGPPKHTLRAQVYLYVANPNTNSVSADMALNGLLDAVQAALKPDPGWGTQTLGGAVHAVWMGQDNDIEIYAGMLGERAAAIVPVEIIVFQ